MKQVLQSLKDGQIDLADVPCPNLDRGGLLIRTSRSLVSVGTERMLVDFGKANLIEKARQQPDKVRMTLDKAKTDGVLPTIEAVRNKLDRPLSLGYCNVGVVCEVGDAVGGFSTGERIVSNGKHAEAVSVPVNLCAKVPSAVSDDEAAFTVVGAIALQGIRLAQPTLGETVVVTGLGLIGLMTVQLLRSHGCRVLGIDLDSERLELARSFGAETVDLSAKEDPVAAAQAFSRQRGIDAVIVTASTRSSEPIHQAALMCRKRGRIVLVGVTGLELSRADFHEKELTFQVSCSYGPGRYDPSYEEKGQDYPIGFVRWTEQRNFEAVLDMMADGRIDVKPLITHRFPIDEAERAYEVVSGSEPSLGILLEYPQADTLPDSVLLRRSVSLKDTEARGTGKAVVSFIGSGNYATGVLIPAMKAAGAELRHVVSSGGTSSVYAGKKYGFEEATTDPRRVFDAVDVDAVIITSRHDTHAQFVIEALEADKHVFVEKPLCLTDRELTAIQTVYEHKVETGVPPILMVGFNRRFSPQIAKMKELLSGNPAPKSIVMTINAGAVPADHWTQDSEVGGGRIVGEACHFIDLARYLSGSRIEKFERSDMESSTKDTATLQLAFADGSMATVHYLANGHRGFPKERLEVFCAGRVLQLDNFRYLRGFGWPGFRRMHLWRQDKGQRACAAAFIEALRDGLDAPIPVEEIFEVANVTLALSSK